MASCNSTTSWLRSSKVAEDVFGTQLLGRVSGLNY
jgi:hypothetical protein